MQSNATPGGTRRVGETVVLAAVPRPLDALAAEIRAEVQAA